MNEARVLIVDNDPAVVKQIQGEFENQGFDVVTALDGAEALEILSEKPEFHAVITNLSMPMVSGLELCRKIGITYKIIDSRLVF